jgi:hypothetical protein
MFKELFGCKEDYYKDLLEVEKEKVEVYKKGYNAANRSYNQLLEITKDLLIMMGDEIDQNSIMKSIENATVYNKKLLDE